MNAIVSLQYSYATPTVACRVLLSLSFKLLRSPSSERESHTYAVAVSFQFLFMSMLNAVSKFAQSMVLPLTLTKASQPPKFL